MGIEQLIGIPKEELDTPALLIDLDAMERNLDRMAKYLAPTRVKLRPHTKTHKSPLIAHRQLAAGAIGVCCQKLGEAEVMAAAGIRDILICSEIVGVNKIHRLMALAKHANVTVVVDHPENIQALSEAAIAYKITLPVLVDVNLGQNRCGVLPGDSVVRLVEQIGKSPGLSFKGLQGYHGKIQHLQGFENRGQKSQEAMEQLGETVRLLKGLGLEPEVVSGGGTGTYNIDPHLGVITELQAGSYIFMDYQYRMVGGQRGEVFDDFEMALTLLGTVISTPDSRWAVVDIGLKAASIDGGVPVLRGLEGIEYRPGGDEHGILLFKDVGREVRLGEKLEFYPGHGDTTINLHDDYYAIRQGKLEAIWPVAARGRFQ